MPAIKKCWITVLLAFSQLSYAAETTQTISSNQSLKQIIQQEIVENHEFYGMAVYLNQMAYFIDDGSNLIEINSGYSTKENTQIKHLLIVGRFKVLILNLQHQGFEILDHQLQFKAPSNIDISYQVSLKRELWQINPRYDAVRYQQLWKPLAVLAVLIETTLQWLGSIASNNWVLAIFILAILVKLLLLPLSLITHKSQQKVSCIQKKLKPKLAEIKTHYDGEQAHHKIMAAHKKLGVSPFFTLKPMFLTMIQIPFLIAIFNVLGEMPELKGESFLWVNDLTLPDSIWSFGYAIPWFGESLNVMPFIMTMMATATTVSFSNRINSEKTQNTHLHLMAWVFFVLFYPFPFAMVFYWTISNTSQLILQKLSH